MTDDKKYTENDKIDNSNNMPKDDNSKTNKGIDVGLGIIM